MALRPTQRLNLIRTGGHLSYIVIAFIGAALSYPACADSGFLQALSRAAIERTHHSVRYDGSYVSIPYPNGDVPPDRGVCTDVIIRSYRALGIDLQQKVHEDIAAHFTRYPAQRIWGQTRPDTNIDHRRVPNLRTFFSRFGETLSASSDPNTYHAGDIVSWQLPGNLPHIGIVTDKRGATNAPLIAHNIGAGPVVEDMLFRYPITGHYRYTPTRMTE